MLRLFRIPIPAALIILLACACSRERPTVGGTLTIAAPAEPDALLAPFVATTQGKQVVDLLYDYLADIGPDLATTGDAGFRPRLASGWRWSDDSLSIAFSLDPRARWHDGRPVRASDVRFTVRLLKDSTVGSPITSNLVNVDSVSAPDSHTAVAWFHRRTPEQFFELVYNVAVLPEHLLRDVPPAQLRASEFGKHPIGSGPYRFARWVPATVLELRADSTYHLGRPSLDRIAWTVTSDPTSAAVRLARGEADFIESVRGEALARVHATPGLRVVRYGSLDYGYLGFNLRDAKDARRANALFADRALRVALSHALDRPTLVRNVLDSLGAVGIGPLTRAMATADTTIAPPNFDPSVASRMLDSLGWRLAGATGVREKQGRPLAFELLVPTSSAVRRRMAVLVQSQLAAVGARVTITELEANAFAERLTGHRYDAVLNAWRSDPSPANIRQSWSTSAFDDGSNYGGYASARFDALVDSASATLDPRASREIYRRAYRQILEDAPAIWIYELRNAAAVSDRVTVTGMRADAWWAGLSAWQVGAAKAPVLAKREN
jgi:peptide/nickel transport system substrate-binding protein